MRSIRAVISGMLMASMAFGPWAIPTARAQGAIDSGVWEKLVGTEYSPKNIVLIPCEEQSNDLLALSPKSNQLSVVAKLEKLELHGKPTAQRSLDAELLVPLSGRRVRADVTYTISRQAFSAMVTSTSNTLDGPRFGAGAMYNITGKFSDGSALTLRVPVFLEALSGLADARSSGDALAQNQDSGDKNYPPGMFDPLTPDHPQIPSEITPDMMKPSDIGAEPPVDPPANLTAGANACWLQYLAACRNAQQAYRAAIAAIPNARVGTGVAGGVAGGALGGLIGGVIVGCIVAASGPLAPVTATIICLSTGAMGVYGGSVGSIAISEELARKAAEDARKAATDSAWAAYQKCLMGLGYSILGG